MICSGESNIAVGVMIVMILSAPCVKISAEESAWLPAGRLSSEQVRGFVEGRGMGQAWIAEIHGYPGPAHVLELAEQLGLSSQQQSATRQLYETMRADAQKLGENLVKRERGLQAAFENRSITQARLKIELDAIGQLNKEIQYLHLSAHLQQVALLSDSQIKLYSQLRSHAMHGAGHSKSGASGHHSQGARLEHHQ